MSPAQSTILHLSKRIANRSHIMSYRQTFVKTSVRLPKIMVSSIQCNPKDKILDRSKYGCGAMYNVAIEIAAPLTWEKRLGLMP